MSDLVYLLFFASKKRFNALQNVVVTNKLGLYRYITRTNVSFFDSSPMIKERNIRARNITI